MVELSIIIINYNTFDLTCKCIESIMEQTKGVSYEIILVDNASVECSPERFKEVFPSVILLSSTTNLGFSKGNNLGISAASGSYILLLNSDTELLNDAATIALQYLQNNSSIGVVSGKLQYSNGKLQHNCQRFPNVKVSLFELFRLQKIFRTWAQQMLLGPFFDYTKTTKVDWVWGTFFMFRKSDLKTFPNELLHDTFFMYGEDMQWCFEFRKSGLQTWFIPDAKILHHTGASKGESHKMIRKNEEIFLEKYYSPVSIYLLKMVNWVLGK